MPRWSALIHTWGWICWCCSSSYHKNRRIAMNQKRHEVRGSAHPVLKQRTNPQKHRRDERRRKWRRRNQRLPLSVDYLFWSSWMTSDCGLWRAERIHTERQTQTCCLTRHPARPRCLFTQQLRGKYGSSDPENSSHLCIFFNLCVSLLLIIILVDLLLCQFVCRTLWSTDRCLKNYLDWHLQWTFTVCRGLNNSI